MIRQLWRQELLLRTRALRVQLRKRCGSILNTRTSSGEMSRSEAACITRWKLSWSNASLAGFSSAWVTPTQGSTTTDPKRGRAATAQTEEFKIRLVHTYASGDSVRTIHRTCSWSVIRTSFQEPRSSKAPQALCSAVGTWRASCVMRADDL